MPDTHPLPPAVPYADLSVRHQCYSDIIVTAAEGGIAYWASCRDYRHEVDGVAVGACVRVRDAEDRSEPRRLITVGSIARAFARVARGEGIPQSRQAYWLRAYREAGDGSWDYDAEDADVLVQVAAYGDIVFG